MNFELAYCCKSKKVTCFSNIPKRVPSLGHLTWKLISSVWGHKSKVGARLGIIFSLFYHIQSEKVSPIWTCAITSTKYLLIWVSPKTRKIFSIPRHTPNKSSCFLGMVHYFRYPKIGAHLLILEIHGPRFCTCTIARPKFHLFLDLRIIVSTMLKAPNKLGFLSRIISRWDLELWCIWTNNIYSYLERNIKSPQIWHLDKWKMRNNFSLLTKPSLFFWLIFFILTKFISFIC